MAIRDDDPDLAKLAEMRARARQGGGVGLQRRQRRLGRLLARERIELLLDPGSFAELGELQRLSPKVGAAEPPPGDGVVAGLGTIDGRSVAVYTSDITVMRGALGVGGARKICRVLDLARHQGIPIVTIHDSDGVRLTEGPAALAGFAEVLGRTATLSGWVPQISVALGLCVGGAAYGAALQDVVIGQRGASYMFVTGSKVAEVVTGQYAPIEELGGVDMHAQRTGLVHFARNDEAECLATARAVLAYLPQNARAPLSARATDDPVDRDADGVMAALPDSPRKGYDVRKIIRSVFDRDSFLELQESYARSLVVGFARLAGRAVGIVASQPCHYAGCLEIESSRKGARFIQLCSAFGLPVITLADVPGFLPGVQQEQGGLLLHGAKLIAAYAACRSPTISLIVRKSYGGGSVLSFSADLRLAYPFARVQPMGTEAAKAVAAHRTFGEALGADADRTKDADEMVRERLGDLYDSFEAVAAAGIVDEIIHPRETRRRLAAALVALENMPRREMPARFHPNMPL